MCYTTCFFLSCFSDCFSIFSSARISCSGWTLNFLSSVFSARFGYFLQDAGTVFGMQSECVYCTFSARFSACFFSVFVRMFQRDESLRQLWSLPRSTVLPTSKHSILAADRKHKYQLAAKGCSGVHAMKRISSRPQQYIKRPTHSVRTVKVLVNAPPGVNAP